MTIPIIFAIDNNVVMQCGVTITSLLLNAKVDTFYDIYILCNKSQLSKGSRDNLLKAYEGNEKCRISFVDVGEGNMGDGALLISALDLLLIVVRGTRGIQKRSVAAVPDNKMHRFQLVQVSSYSHFRAACFFGKFFYGNNIFLFHDLNDLGMSVLFKHVACISLKCVLSLICHMTGFLICYHKCSDQAIISTKDTQ